MLIEFRVKNFRSLRDEQTLSLVADKDKSLQESNTMPSGIKAAPTLLRSMAIFGPNAGGKSNLIKALQFIDRKSVV
jgi:AAA15 family ATPase/GTPase